MNNFYCTEFEIWAGFGPVGNTAKKKLGPIMSNFRGQFFHVIMGKKIIQFSFLFKYCSVRNKKLHKMKVEKIFKKFLKNQ